MPRVEVIPYIAKEDEYEQEWRNGRYIGQKLVMKRGQSVVSHGVDIDTGRIVILPTDDYNTFVRLFCEREGGAWILKE